MELKPELHGAAKKELLRLAMFYKSIAETGTSAAQATIKRENTGSDYCDLFEDLDDRNVAEQRRPLDDVNDELRVYLQFVASGQHRHCEPVVFWLQRKQDCPTIANIAVDILAIPATTAPIERVFSQARLCLGIYRERLSDKNLKEELLIRVNKKIVSEMGY